MKKRIIASIFLLVVCIMSFAFGATAMVGAEGSASTQDRWNITEFDSISEFGAYDIIGMENLRVEEDGGRKYISGTTTTQGAAVMQKIFDPIDLSECNLREMYLQISFYIEDMSALKVIDNFYGCLELTSSGNYEDERMFWVFEPNKAIGTDCSLKKGWNDWAVNLAGPHRVGGSPIKVDQINFVRLYFFTTTPMKIAYDKVALVQIKDVNMPVDFGEETVGNIQTNNATVVAGDKTSEITLNQGNSVLLTDKYNIAVPTARLAKLNVNYTAEEPEKIVSAKVVLSDGVNDLIYNLPIDEEVDFSKSLDLFDGKSGYVDITALKEISILFETSQKTKVVINSLYVDTLAKELERAIDKIEEVTVDNYLEQQPLFDDVNELCGKYINITGITSPHYTQIAYNYLRYDLLKEKLDYVQACVDNGIYMEMIIPDAYYEIGALVEITLNVKNLSSSCRNDTYSLEFDEFYFEEQGSTTGKVELLAGAERTITLYLLAKQGGFQTVSAVITANDSSKLGWSEYVVVDDEGVFKSDNHTKSIQSDGNYALEMNYYTGVTQMGLTFIYSTDHDADPGDLNDITYAKKVLAAAGLEKFLVMKGNEITGATKVGTDYSLGGHMLHYNSDTYYPAPDYMDRDSNVYLYRLYMQQIYEEGGYSYLAHPRDEWHPFAYIGEDYTRVDVYTHHTGFEIFNSYLLHGGSYWQWDRTLEVMQLWDRYNITGQKKYFAIANSDAHSINDISCSYTGFLLQDYSELSINNAIGSGHMYASSGVDFLLCTLDGVQMSETVFANSEKDAQLKIILRDTLQTIKKVKLISYEMNFSSKPEDSDAGYATREEIVLYDDQNGEYNKNVVEIDEIIKVKPNRFYRIEATSNTDEQFSGNAGAFSVRYGCSNPFWVMGEASSFTLDKESLNLEVGKWHKLEVTQTDSLYDTVLYSSSAPDKVQVEVSGKVTVLEGCPDGVYTITAKTSSGSVVKTVSVTVGEVENNEEPNPPVKPDDKKEGCGGSVSGVSVTLALTVLTLGVAIIFKRRKA